MIHSIAGFQEVSFLLLDMCLTLGRIAHALYAMSSVYLASQQFLRELGYEIMLSQRNGPFTRSRKLGKVFQTITPIVLKLGPVKCTKSLPLTGMAEYAKYYINAALWPSV